MKFLGTDEQLFKAELKSSGLTEAEFIKRRDTLVTRMKDQQRSAMSKDVWKKNRWKILKGIKRFHKSTQGKRFHRQLGRFLATRDTTKKGILAYREAKDLVQTLASLLTYTFLEKDFYMSVVEAIEYELFSDETYDEVMAVLTKIKALESIDDHFDFLLWVVSKDALIKELSETLSITEEVILQEVKAAEKEFEKEDKEEGYYLKVDGSLRSRLNAIK